MSKPLYRVKTRFIPSKKTGAKAHEGKTRADIIRTTDNKVVKSKTCASEVEARDWAASYIAGLKRGIEQGIDDSVDAQMTVASLIAQFLASPAGKALGAQPGRQVQWWRNHLGNVALVRLDKVTIERELVRYMAEPCEVYLAIARLCPIHCRSDFLIHRTVP